MCIAAHTHHAVRPRQRGGDLHVVCEGDWQKQHVGFPAVVRGAGHISRQRVQDGLHDDDVLDTDVARQEQVDGVVVGSDVHHRLDFAVWIGQYLAVDDLARHEFSLLEICNKTGKWIKR